jgi:hypothetical protein
VKARDEDALRAYLARILGWSAERAVSIEYAIRSIRLSIAHCAALVRSGTSTSCRSRRGYIAAPSAPRAPSSSAINVERPDPRRRVPR